VDSGFIDITMDDPLDVSSIAAAPSPRLSSHERIKSAVKILRDGRILIIDFMLTILDPSELDFAYNRDWIYNRSKQEKESVNGQGKKGKLEKMFDCLFGETVMLTVPGWNRIGIMMQSLTTACACSYQAISTV